MNSTKAPGIALIISSILMIMTMILHPVGGDFQHLVKISLVARVSHSLAILSLPFAAYGFWGLTKRLGNQFFSQVAFTIMIFGLIAAMLAAAVNGLILIDFVNSYADVSSEDIDSLEPIFVLIKSFNHTFDFIMIGGACLSTLFWSIAILKSKALPAFGGYLGLLLSLSALILLFIGFVLIDLFGFRMFIFGWVAWIIIIGYVMVRNTNEVKSSNP